MTKLIIYFSVLLMGIWGCHSTKSNPESEAIALPDNSQNSLDWAGAYRGNLPCADCEGIQTEIILNADETYVITRKYLGKSVEIFKDQGRFIWDKSGGRITLQVNGEPDRYAQYRVGENKLAKLDEEGNLIQGALAQEYMLLKVYFDPGIVEKYWKLTEINGQPIIKNNPRNQEAHFMLKKEGGLVFGNGSCNSFNGTYELKHGNRISFSRLSSTMMACENVDIEGEFFKVFEMTDNYTFQEDTLFLNKAKMAPLARFEAVYFD